ncbi:coiled-coil domain-containing protein 105-like [Dendronephthya gigantea]|uniref:coiled-coil domain-containing protein 105-like n=1 Tax=Dendronephthya gigantea TaxID=151771 RepID=UPI00106A95C5|nr:coiled-coil domain-containing protein 105-like [Dendronephthya gigantea]
MEVTRATIGSDPWKKASVKNLQLSKAVMDRSEHACELGKNLDPLPSLRDNCIQESNARIHAYVRATRAVVVKLRESFLETNKEIKSLTRCKESLERALEHIRKDLSLNQRSCQVRATRPPRERLQDGADNLLTSERQHLLTLKRTLENQLRAVQRQLHHLDSCRKRLSAVLQERSQATDLICQAVSSVKGSPHRSRDKLLEKPQTPPVEPLGPYTPEAANSITNALQARESSAVLRKSVNEAIQDANQLQNSTHFSVNHGLTQKVAETVNIKQHLQVSSGQAKMAINRGQRWYDSTGLSMGYALGPVTYSDLTTREKLDRPMVGVFQRHPGNQLPEARDIVSGNDGLLDSLNATGRNLGLLKLTKLRLDADARDKSEAALLDSKVVRMRRRLANHRWVVGDQIKC